MKPRLLTYGLLGDELKHISEVTNGLACNCVCAKCKQRLVAKNNPKNQKIAHFAHHADIECEGAYETTLHLLAKSILYKTKQLRLPDFRKSSFLKEGKLVTFDEIIRDGQRVNVESNTIIPDSIGKINGKEIFIKFANTHFVDYTKNERIKKSEIACVEIDLREQLLDESSLTTFFKTRNSSIYWINNPRMEHQYKIEREKAKLRKLEKEKEEQEQRRQQELLQKRERNKVLEKLKNYKTSKTEKILQRSDSNKVNKCPKKFEALSKLKLLGFYKHDILRRIIDGEFWNGEFYGHRPYGLYIFLNNQKIFVYHPDREYENEAPQEKKFAKYFYAGLCEISKVLNLPEIGDCENCEFFVEHISIDDKNYEICRHVKSANNHLGKQKDN